MHATACIFALTCFVMMIVLSLLGVELQHPGVEKDTTVLWCKSAAERDVRVASASALTTRLTLLLQDIIAAINIMRQFQ